MSPAENGTVLVADDDLAVGTVLAALLVQAGFTARHVASGEAALQVLASRAIDVVITDLRMPGMDGMQVLAAITARWPETPVIMLTAHGSVPLAVEAMRAGAADFVLKPFDRDEIIFAVEKALHAARHAERSPPAQQERSGGFLDSRSPAMKSAIDLVERAARGNASVLIRGESGTGKELAARAIHELGPRSKGPFTAIHCAALPEALLESELFGYEKGAFTGANCRKPGRLELADGGTLFLDEVGDIPLPMQVKLLRAIQERSFERLGGNETIKVDARIVAATHRDLDQRVKSGDFREDLYYRLNVIPIVLPPLRARREDIAPLAHRFAETLGRENGRAMTLDGEAIALLEKEPWPGNVRELLNFVERLLVLSDGPTISAADVRRELDRGRDFGAAREEAPPASSEAPLQDQRRELEKKAIENALQRAQGNRTVAARILGVSRRTLYNKLSEHGLA